MANRRTPRRKGRTDTVINSKYGQELIPLVGKLMINFGAVELQSHMWIDHLSHDQILVDLAFETPFARRVDLIHQLIDREELDSALKERAHAAWKAAAELSEIRNAVAHNPLIWGWRGEEKGEPDYVGIPVIRRLRGSKDGKVPYIGLDGLRRAVDAIVKVGGDISALLQQVSPHFSKAENHPPPAGGAA